MKRTSFPSEVSSDFTTHFWNGVERRGIDDCWLWKRGVTNGAGAVYGRLTHQRAKYLAHRMAFFLTYGDPEELVVMHRCDNGLCCNPEHFCIGTIADNNADKAEKGRTNPAFGEANGLAVLTERQAKEIFQRGYCNKERYSLIARDLGVSEDTVRSVCVGETWRHVTGMSLEASEVRTQIGQSNGYAKLTDDQVREIYRRRHEEGHMYKTIAEDFGISASSVGFIATGKTWKHITTPLTNAIK